MPFVLSGVDDLLAATGRHPYVRLWLRHDPVEVRSWTSRGTAVWWVRDRGKEPDVAALGPPAHVADLLGQLAPVLPERVDLSVPSGTAGLLTGPVRLTSTVAWEFRWTERQPPVVAGERRVAVLAHGTDAEVAELLERSSGRPSALPGDPSVRRWVGVRGTSGALVAVAADTSGPDMGFISSVATAPAARRQGLGAAVTAYLTRLLLDEFGLSSLALYSDNDAARRLYLRLGYHDVQAVHSGARAQV